MRATAFLSVLEQHGIQGKKTASTLTRDQALGVLDALQAQGEAESTPAKKPAKKAAAKKAPAKKAAKKGDAKKSEGKGTAKKVEPEAVKADVQPEPEKPVEEPAAVEEADKKPARKRAPRKVTRKTASKSSKSEKLDKADKAEKQKPAEAPAVEEAPKAEVKEKSKTEPKAESKDEGQSKSQRSRVRRRVVRRIGAAARNDETPEQAEQPEEAPKQAKRAEEPAKREAKKAQQPAKQSQPEPKQTKQSKQPQDPEHLHPGEREDADVVDEPVRLKGSTRLESRRRWRAENKEKNFKAITRSEFLARRESVERQMVVRDSQRSDHQGLTTQVGVVEDGVLVEHFVTSETQTSIMGNIYLGRVQNVLSSMEAAFIDIGTGRNAVLYAGEMNWRSPHLHSKSRRIDAALKAGDQILVQVIKDPLGHKGARLTARISFAGRYLVYFPGGTTAGISRKLPEAERKRLKNILAEVIPGEGGAIIRTAAESVSEEQISDDVQRLHKQWLAIEKEEQQARERKGAKPIALYEEPNMLIKVVRDLFNEDFSELIIEGQQSWKMVRDYVGRMAQDLKDRVVKWDPNAHGGQDVFAAMGLDEQLAKALSRKVWLPSGGHLVFDRTEAMTVIDVNTGSFVGSGGNLEETVTQNNLEAAEEIVRQMRLRDLGGMIVVDFIDMVLQENQDLVLRRLTEYLGRDRTRHKVSEVTSLGLVQMTRKRLGTGLLETFSTTCEACEGRGVIVHADPVEQQEEPQEPRRDHGHRKERQQARKVSSQRRHHEDSASKFNEIAKAALDTAKKEDPDDLWDKSFVLDEPAKPAGEKSSKTEPQRKHQAEPQQSEQREPEQKQERPRRRVRRVVRRKNEPERPAQQGKREDRREDKPAKQGKQADQRGRAGKAGAGEDVDFDSSPRRKRQTRGNSRSDVRGGGQREQQGEGQKHARTDQEAVNRRDAKSGSAGRRRGRRVVRSRN
ncbi:MAG TPA: Rne/Rng family ribonuclease [Candidatus Corynebacterium gallistercoris]|uniref:Ribonuclease E n=1 Tax=Candidatus Corynebacterium gallistercoris TaxID=2838530 RepID=A0A9D1S1Z6_9CORY|nr:Rne/Rng family ribonuclease [Candidatus Corynebacterium gallistercoris]